MKLKVFTLPILLAVVCLSGCGDSEKFPLASARGVVLCESQPVPFVQVYFHPVQEGTSAIVGKPGIGITDENGVFNISTYSPGDGAVIGKHEIRIGVSVGTSPDCPADLSNGNALEVVEVVKKGNNEFTFTLPKRDPRRKLVLEDD